MTLTLDFEGQILKKSSIMGIRGRIDIQGYESIGCSVGNSVKKLQVLMA